MTSIDQDFGLKQDLLIKDFKMKILIRIKRGKIVNEERQLMLMKSELMYSFTLDSSVGLYAANSLSEHMAKIDAIPYPLAIERYSLK